ncbi:hypothetical protein HGI47_11075 [Novosphingobium sp. ERN07]|nr:hypothetical protein [Novosphingobium sp. ERN07]
MADQIIAGLRTAHLDQLLEKIAQLSYCFRALWCSDGRPKLRHSQLVKDRSLIRRKLQLPVDHLEREMMGIILNQIGLASINDLSHQRVDYRIDNALTPLANHLWQERLLEHFEQATMFRRVHHRDRSSETLSQTMLEDVMITKALWVHQHAPARVVTEHQVLVHMPELEIGNVSKQLPITAIVHAAAFISS